MLVVWSASDGQLDLLKRSLDFGADKGLGASCSVDGAMMSKWDDKLIRPWYLIDVVER